LTVVNPFATRFTQPGRIMPMDADGQPVDLAALLARLDSLGGRAVIAGPHGSGKSTLLARLQAQAAARGQPTLFLRLGQGPPGRDAAAAVKALLNAAPGSMVLLDSWERLGQLARWATRMAARCRGCHLVVTAHRHAGLPVLIHHEPTIATLLSIVWQLPEATHWLGSVIHDADIREAFTRHAPNLREALFHLYDLFEERQLGRRTSGS
jgi:Mrp family chromosome partitioning ATPase